MDGRRRNARRIRDIADALAERLGGWEMLPPLRATQVRRYAELSTLAEERRYLVLCGRASFGPELVALERLVDRLAGTLGLMPMATGPRSRRRSASLTAPIRAPIESITPPSALSISSTANRLSTEG
jgi:hypothetical protein